MSRYFLWIKGDLFEDFWSLLVELLLASMMPFYKLQNGALSSDDPFNRTTLCKPHSAPVVYGRPFPLVSKFPCLPRPVGMIVSLRPVATLLPRVSWPWGLEECIYLCLIAGESFGHLGVLERSLLWGSGQICRVLLPLCCPSLWDLC